MGEGRKHLLHLLFLSAFAQNNPYDKVEYFGMAYSDPYTGMSALKSPNPTISIKTKSLELNDVPEEETLEPWVEAT